MKRTMTQAGLGMPVLKKGVRAYKVVDTTKMTIGARIKKAIEKSKEGKYVDRKLVTAAALTTAGLVSKLSLIPQGTTDVTRIGDAVTLTGVELRVDGSSAAAGSADTSIVRYVVFQWKADDTTAPIVGDILDLSVSTAPYTAPYNHDKKSQYKIIDDFRIAVSATGPDTYQSVRKYFGRRMLKDVRFLAAGNNGYNHVYIISVANNTVVANSIDTRVEYTDA